MNSIKLPVGELKKALSGIGKVLPKRGDNPVLEMVKVEQSPDGWITLTGTDQTHFASVRFEEPAEGEACTLLVPYEDLQLTVKFCAPGEQIEVEERNPRESLIRYPIADGLAERWVRSADPRLFPRTPCTNSEPIPLPEKLRSSLEEGFRCTSHDPTRPLLNGVFVDVSRSDCHTLVGSDGKHLYASNSFSVPLKNSVLIPRSSFLGWREFQKDGGWRLSVGRATRSENDPGSGQDGDQSQWLRIESRRWSFTTKEPEGSYPNWRAVVPSCTDATTVVVFTCEQAEQLLRVIGRMPCTDRVLFTIQLAVQDGRVSLAAKSGSAQAPVEVEVQAESVTGENLKVLLNRQLLSKALEFGLCRIELFGGDQPVRFVEGGRQMLVMPIRNPAETSPEPHTNEAQPTEASSAKPVQAEPHIPEGSPREEPPEGYQAHPRNLDEEGAPPPGSVRVEAGAPDALNTALPEEVYSTENDSLEKTYPEEGCDQKGEEAACAEALLVEGIAEIKETHAALLVAAARLVQVRDLLNRFQMEAAANNREIQRVRETLQALRSVRI